jgi:hypothetical protein
MPRMYLFGRVTDSRAEIVGAQRLRGPRLAKRNGLREPRFRPLRSVKTQIEYGRKKVGHF